MIKSFYFYFRKGGDEKNENVAINSILDAMNNAIDRLGVKETPNGFLNGVLVMIIKIYILKKNILYILKIKNNFKRLKIMMFQMNYYVKQFQLFLIYNN